MTPPIRVAKIDIAKSGEFDEGTYSYINSDDLEKLFYTLEQALSVKKTITIYRNGHEVGVLTSVALEVSEPKGKYISGMVTLTDSNFMALPGVYISTLIRQSLINDSGFKLTSDDAPKIKTRITKV